LQSCSFSGSRPGSGSQSPCAGPHSKHKKGLFKPCGGAKDVWTFFKKSNHQHTCILCK
jgi:hypothetical protein